MKFKFPPSKKEKPKHFLSLDIGTETVKGLVFSDFSTLQKEKSKKDSSRTKSEEQSKKIVIQSISTQYFDEFGVFNTTDFTETILKKTISKVIKEIQEKTEFKTDILFLGLPASILRGRVVSQNFQRENPEEIISEIEKDRICKEVFNRTKIKLSQEFAQEVGLLPEDFYFHNFKILEMKLDGYEVFSLQGLSGENVELKVLAVFLSRHCLEKIKKVLESFDLRIQNIIHKSENLSLLFQKKNINAIYLDIGGQLTKIFLVEKERLGGILEFKSGGIDFTRKISRIFGVSLQRARVLKHNYSQSLLSEQMNARLREIFSEDIRNWFDAFKKNLKKVSKKLLPSNIFLFGGGSLLPEIQKILEKGDWSDFPLVVHPEVKYIYPRDLNNIENRTKGLKSPQEIPLLLIFHEQKKIF